MNNHPPAAAYADRVLRQSSADLGFVTLLHNLNVSLVAAIRPGAVVAFGAMGDALSISCTPISQPMGMAWDGKLLAIGGRRDITVFAPSTRLAMHLPGKEERHDVVFVPIAVYRTGECMIHEMAIDGPSIVFTNTLFSCIARAEGTQSFIPLWRPSFISQLMPEDRCHLNSFATEGRRIRYATAFSASDTRQGFRELPINSGIVIDVEKSAVVVAGLTRPHSVRMFDGRLYVLDSGLGAVLLIDPEAQKSKTLAMLPGFTRGMRRYGNVLFVGLSTLRASAMPLNLPLAAREETLFAGIAALDLESGRLLGTLRLAPEVEELFDFVVIPDVRRALVFDPVMDAPLVAIETPDNSFLMTSHLDQLPEGAKSQNDVTP